MQSVTDSTSFRRLFFSPAISRIAFAQAPAQVVLQDGSTIPIRLSTPIDTAKAKTGDAFQATIAANVFSGAFVVVPIGAPITGRVVEAKAAGDSAGRPS